MKLIIKKSLKSVETLVGIKLIMFTNWLTSEATASRSSVITKEFNNTSTLPPDITIEVGPPPLTRFPAHSTLLSANSGYFRAAIIRAGEANGNLIDNSIYLPNISVEHFTPLLTYMYTGFLDLNLENIFGVLLATHLLHMPRALEICRDFLSHTQRHQNLNDPFYASAQSGGLVNSLSGTSKVIRPIASKASNNSGLNFISAPKSMANSLHTSHDTPFKSLINIPVSSCEEIPIKIPRLSENKILKNLDDKKSPIFLTKKSHSIKLTHIQRKPPPAPAVGVVNENHNVTTNEICGIVSESDKVIIDIASCDGPVRFRRVLNEAFELNKKPTPQSSNCTDEAANEFKIKYQHSNAISFHQQMVRNINEQYKQQNSSFSSQLSEESENSQHSTELYTCVYCKHTFKSKYCYQKHAKRHLNPLNPLKCRGSDGNESSDQELGLEAKKVARKSPTLTVTPTILIKRDCIKPLDMNVQYYPCKTCGCKFPSYYFVHKHRKMCHPEIGADGTVQQPDDGSYHEEKSNGEIGIINC